MIICSAAAGNDPWLATLTGIATRYYAESPASFVSGHGIDAASNGVQTFRAFHCLVAIIADRRRAGSAAGVNLLRNNGLYRNPVSTGLRCVIIGNRQ